MVTNKATFIEHYLVLYQKDLLEHLPEKAHVTQMLHVAGQIINNLNTHLIAAIHQNLKTEE